MAGDEAARGPAISLTRADRGSDSPLVSAVWATESISDGVYLAVPDGAWDLIIAEGDVGVVASFNGQATQAVQVPYRAGGFAMGIALRAHSHLVGLPGPLHPGDALHLPVVRGRVEIAGREFAIPTFETAEAFVDDLVRAGLLETDELVLRALSGRVFASDRTIQRHFRATTGISPYTFEQIRRAHRAADLLRAGERPADVAVAAGYSDQPHLTRSLRRILGQTPKALQGR